MAMLVPNCAHKCKETIVERFTSGWKRNYYGKGDVTVFRLDRNGSTASGQSAVFGANVSMLVYGEAFWPTYVTGDNTGLIATDSMKNFIQRETLHFTGYDLEGFCRFIGTRFLEKYPYAEGVQVSAIAIPYAALPAGNAYSPAGPERATARVELRRRGEIVEAVSGLRDFRLLRLRGSAFNGFVQDEYTTLKEVTDRPLHMWLDLEWQYATPKDAFNDGVVSARVRTIVREVFASFQSSSMQQVIHQIGTALLNDIPTLSEVHLEANNRTWDTIVESGSRGIYTDARPAYGCLGLRLRR
jgi:urate oxidase / 2-oxo-4-hydroxy-4-carboxy-5-ureidoimidazoline decarboxylase